MDVGGSMRLSYTNLDSNPPTLESVSGTFLHHQAPRVTVTNEILTRSLLQMRLVMGRSEGTSNIRLIRTFRRSKKRIEYRIPMKVTHRIGKVRDVRALISGTLRVVSHPRLLENSSHIKQTNDENNSNNKTNKKTTTQQQQKQTYNKEQKEENCKTLPLSAVSRLSSQGSSGLSIIKSEKQPKFAAQP